MRSIPSNGIVSSNWYAQVIDACNIEERHRSFVAEIVEGADRRLVGKSSLLNVIVKLQSLKNAQPRLVESHTCELLYAYELEMDPSVIAYGCQPPCKGVVRTDNRRRRHVSSAHLDFIVFRRDSITLIECKKASWLESQGSAKGWIFESGSWRHRAYEDFAANLGLLFSAWTPPSPAGTYQSNLELCYAALMDGSIGTDLSLVNAAVVTLRKGDMTIDELQRAVRGFRPRHALIALGKSLAFGPLASVSLSDTEKFFLSVNRAATKANDHANLATTVARYHGPTPTSDLSLASCTDIAGAQTRMEWLDRIGRGEAPDTRYAKALRRKIEAAQQLGVSPIEASLTSYHRSGNRTLRLPTESQATMTALIEECWTTGTIHRQIDLFYELMQRCRDRDILCPSKKKLWRALQEVSRAKVALATGGKRAFHAARSASDPWERSVTPIAFGQVVHVDSTDMDIRHAPDLLEGVPDEKAKVYLAIDGATGCPVAHALIFGPARTDGLALLHRDYIRRHGRCPVMYHFDRGPENKSHWVDALCRGNTHIRWSPAGGSQFNSIVESTLKQINHQISHRLLGNTLPDRAGRSVDGKFKSRQNAATSFVAICELLETLLYNDIPEAEGCEGMTPNDRYKVATSQWGRFGNLCDLNADVMWETAVPIKAGKNVVRNRGIRTENGFYVSDGVSRRLGRAERVVEIRSDPADPSFIYVAFGRFIEKAFHSRVQSLAQLTDPQRLFELLWAPLDRASKRSSRSRQGLARYKRNKAVNTATFARLAGVEEPHSAPAMHRKKAVAAKTPVPEWASLEEYGEHYEDA